MCEDMRWCPFSVKETCRFPLCLDCRRQPGGGPAAHADASPSSLHRGPQRWHGAHTTRRSGTPRFPREDGSHLWPRSTPPAARNLHSMTRACVSPGRQRLAPHLQLSLHHQLSSISSSPFITSSENSMFGPVFQVQVLFRSMKGKASGGGPRAHLWAGSVWVRGCSATVPCVCWVSR